MARKRASMREGPLAELFRATEAAQRQAEQQQTGTPEAAVPATEPDEATVEHVPSWEEQSGPEPSPAEVTHLRAAPPSGESLICSCWMSVLTAMKST